MGCDNADGEFVYAKESGRAFVEFTGEDERSPIYRRADLGLGVYGVKLFDFDRPEGNQLLSDIDAAIDPDIIRGPVEPVPTYSNKSVAVFVLDCRTNKTPWKHGADKYQYDFDGDFLGETQWSKLPCLMLSLLSFEMYENICKNALTPHRKTYYFCINRMVRGSPKSIKSINQHCCQRPASSPRSSPRRKSSRGLGSVSQSTKSFIRCSVTA
jgi:hypothetical protein